ncbi:MAG: FtsX-like permease family protein [Chloroflexota bacterium]|jgi:putative ABC transport system permease protein
MNLLKLAWRNTYANPFRSVTVLICAGLMAGFAVAATIVIGGAQKSLNLALDRLGADIIVVSAGSEVLMENAFLMGVPARTWMPREVIDQIAIIPGVEKVSPQFFLATLRGAACCSVPEMFLIAYEPETDFTLKPWLESNLEDGLNPGEAVGGAFIFVPKDPGYILIYGSEVILKGNLEPTGTGLDRSMFFTFETAYKIAQSSPEKALDTLDIPANSVSAAMVKTHLGTDIHQVAEEIQDVVPDVTPVESSNLFHSQRLEIIGLLKSVLALLGVAWLLCVALIGLAFSMAVNERRQEIGVLRALGFPRPLVLRSLLSEGLILALAGGIGGIALFTFAVYLFRNLIVQIMGVPFLFPTPIQLIALSAGALALTLISVTLGALIPILRVSLMDPSLAMRN